jgi:hypothetical protein
MKISGFGTRTGIDCSRVISVENRKRALGKKIKPWV